jgi:hypothetical protein
MAHGMLLCYNYFVRKLTGETRTTKKESKKILRFTVVYDKKQILRSENLKKNLEMYLKKKNWEVTI